MSTSLATLTQQGNQVADDDRAPIAQRGTSQRQVTDRSSYRQATPMVLADTGQVRPAFHRPLEGGSVSRHLCTRHATLAIGIGLDNAGIDRKDWPRMCPIVNCQQKCACTNPEYHGICAASNCLLNHDFIPSSIGGSCITTCTIMYSRIVANF